MLKKLALLNLLVLNVLCIDLSDLDEYGTPESYLERKCVAYPAASTFYDNACYLQDPSGLCNQIRGFKSSVAKYDPKLIGILETEGFLDPATPTKFSDKTYGESNQDMGSVVCKYTDHFECETGWTKHGTHCFKVFTEKVKHAEAQNICRSNKATLAVPHEDRTLQFLSDIVYLKNTTDHSNNHFFWIGLFVENHITLKTSDGTNANHYRWLPLGHKRSLVEAFKTPNTAVALASSPANAGNHVGVFGYNQVINGNFHKLPFVCQQIANNFGRKIYVPGSILNK